MLVCSSERICGLQAWGRSKQEPCAREVGFLHLKHTLVLVIICLNVFFYINQTMLHYIWVNLATFTIISEYRAQSGVRYGFYISWSVNTCDRLQFHQAAATGAVQNPILRDCTVCLSMSPYPGNSISLLTHFEQWAQTHLSRINIHTLILVK